MRDIPSHGILFKDLDKTFQHSDVLEMARLTAFHDFIVFLAVSYRNTIMAGLKIIDARHSAVNTLKRKPKIYDPCSSPPDHTRLDMYR